MNKRAESLMETIIAVTVIALGMTGAGLIVRTSMFGNSLTQDRMAALNFAREGIEAVRGIRDTNWLRYNGSCWNSLTGTSESDCDFALIEGVNNSYYAIKIDESSLGYFLEESPAGDDIFDETYRIYECEIENPDSGATGAIYGNPIDPSACVETVFFRNVYVVYDTGDPITASSMTATVTVGWTTEGEEKTVERQTIINN